MRKFLTLSAAMTGLLISSSIWAQEVLPEEDQIITGHLSGADMLTLDEIVTVATRTNERRYTYPAKIDKLTDDRLEELSPVHAAEALNNVPGVHIHRGSGLEHLTSLRSPVLTGGAGAGSFLYLQDGIPLRAAGFSNVNGLFEAQTAFGASAEVFKGPGSVTYGSNALHGLINFNSRLPDDKNRYQILASEDGYLSGVFSLSSQDPHKDGGHMLNLSLVDDNGFRDASGYSQQKLQTTLTRSIGKWEAVWRTSVQNLEQETAGFIRGDDAYLDDSIRFTNPNPEAYRDSKSARTQLRLKTDLGEKKLILIPYARWTDMEFLRHFVPGQATEKVGHWSIGVANALHGFTGNGSYILGVDAEYTNGYLDEFQAGSSVFSFVQGAHYDYNIDAITLAGYGEYDWEIARNTHLKIGARAEYVDYNYDNLIDTTDVGRFRRVDDRSDDFFVLTPKVALTSQIADNLHLYARAVRGARAPQITDLYSLQTQQQPGEIESETLDSLEIGIKKGSQTFSFEAAAYAMEKDNFFFRNSAGLNVVNGKTSHRGLEASARWKPAEWIELSSNINFADHTYNFSDAASSVSNTIVDGAKVDTAPEIYGTGVIKLMPIDDFSAEVEWRHLGEYFLDPGNTETYPGHDVFVLRGQYKFSEVATVFARMDNLFDKRYANRADFAFGSERYFPGRPRTLFVGLRGEF